MLSPSPTVLWSVNGCERKPKQKKKTKQKKSKQVSFLSHFKTGIQQKGEFCWGEFKFNFTNMQFVYKFSRNLKKFLE